MGSTDSTRNPLLLRVSVECRSRRETEDGRVREGEVEIGQQEEVWVKPPKEKVGDHRDYKRTINSLNM